MPSEFSLSQLAPLGAYVAKRCALRAQLDIVRPGEPCEEVDAAVRLRREDGRLFERLVVDELGAAGGEGWVFAAGDDGERLQQTLAAMRARATVIIGGRLPIDEKQRRVGQPDVLVWHADGYVPVEVKHHRTLDSLPEAAARRDAARTSPLRTPTPDTAKLRTDAVLRKHRDDALQLAHYRRILEAAGFAAKSTWAGVIGTERVVVWYDLRTPLWQHDSDATDDAVPRDKPQLRSTLGLYDDLFEARLELASIALQHTQGAAVELSAPMACSECPSCTWREHCRAQLESGSGDASLLPRIGETQWRLLRQHGVRDREAVARLDLWTARLGASGVDLEKLMAAALPASPATPVATLLPRAKKQHARLSQEGIRTAADVRARIHGATAEFAGARFLPEAILNARAALGAAAVHRRPDVSAPRVPRAAIEIDIDMESAGEHVYLWGVHVTDRRASGLVTPGYRAFVTWDRLDANNEASNFLEFWNWLWDTTALVEAAGFDVHFYVWSHAAEFTRIRRTVVDANTAASIRARLIAPHWIDLEREFRTQWITGGSTSLKSIAPLAGHAWSVEDPGGALSIVKHRLATDQAAHHRQREQARSWLLDYNRGDVEATLAIRDWLDREGASWPQLDSGALGATTLGTDV